MTTPDDDAARAPIMLDQGLSQNIALATRLANVILLIGDRQFDRFMIVDSEGIPEPVALDALCHTALDVDATWLCDPARNRVTLARTSGKNVGDLKTGLPVTTDSNNREKSLSLPDAITALESLALPAGFRVAMLVDAGLLLSDPHTPRDDDFELVRMLERFSRLEGHSRILLLRAPRSSAIPGALVAATGVKTINLPASSRDERTAYAHWRGHQLAVDCDVSDDALARSISNATEDWLLNQVENLLQSATAQKIRQLHDLDELALALRTGATRSPWAGDAIRVAVADAPTRLARRVQGQDDALRAVVGDLRKAVTGLTGANHGRHSEAPRAVFFFAGPTGTGKTECAKAISELVFGQESLLRFDCSEFQQEHAIARLIGAPPGYVGYERGGELTEAVRAKPNSVILMDEIEKANPRLLDAFISVLDDGRLTNGQGETTYFGQSVIVFTSNLGMYEDIETAPGHVMRRPRFKYESPFEDIRREVRKAIREHFVTKIARPELLGRLKGEDNIIVFDYLRNLAGVTRKFVGNLEEKCQRLHGIELVVDDSIIELVAAQTREKPETLVLGGRGLAQQLDIALTNPLANYLFESRARNCRITATQRDGKTVFS